MMKSRREKTGKAPAFQWYPADWTRDTRGLSLRAKGAWIDLLCHMWWEVPKGSVTLACQELSRILGCENGELEGILGELSRQKIANIRRNSDGTFTVVSRRMTREELERQQAKERKRKERHGNGAAKDGVADGDVTAWLRSLLLLQSSSSSSSSVNTGVFTPPTPTDEGGDSGSGKVGGEGSEIGDFRSQNSDGSGSKKPDGTDVFGEERAAWERLRDVAAVRGLTWERFLVVVQGHPGFEWGRHVEEFCRAACLLEGLEHPAAWLEKQVNRIELGGGKVSKKETAAAGCGGTYECKGAMANAVIPGN